MMKPFASIPKPDLAALDSASSSCNLRIQSNQILADGRAVPQGGFALARPYTYWVVRRDTQRGVRINYYLDIFLTRITDKRPGGEVNNTRLRWLPLLLILLLSATVSPTAAQPMQCGTVDAIDLPVDELREGYDDFAFFRQRFGGNHVGIDLAFDRWGDPVRAAATGRVTLADPLEWDTEKGVVILSHTFPDGNIYYTVYGHMEQTDTIRFPAVGTCVERGQVIGAIGWPSRGRPHLHYEVRSRLPNDGGPGYVTGNPVDEGWFNPLDFTALWRVRLMPGFLSAITFDTVPTLPPAQLLSGPYIAASGDRIAVTIPPNQILWRVSTDGAVNALASLPGDRVVAHTRNGQALTLQGGRYVAVWTVESTDLPFIALGETLIFPMPDSSLAAYDAAGNPLWTVPGLTGGEVTTLNRSPGTIGYAIRNGGQIIWRLLNPTGSILAEFPLDAAPLALPQIDDSWLLLVEGQVLRIQGSQLTPLQTLNAPTGSAAQFAADVNGGMYVYLDDSERTLLALNADGSPRWRITYPRGGNFASPLMSAGNCLLYTLDVDGTLHLFAADDGALLNTVQIYPGGRRNSSPASRLLRTDSADLVAVAGGYLTMMFLDGRALAGSAVCP